MASATRRPASDEPARPEPPSGPPPAQAPAQAPGGARSEPARPTRRFWSRLGEIRGSLQRRVARWDPNDDPDAEPIELSALFFFGLALAVSAWMFWRWKYQPMQDAGHHAAMAAVVADYGHKGSLYPPLYEPLSPIVANSLLYEVAGHLGRLIGVTLAFRACVAFYVLGTPLAVLYALRVFGRSAWAAVLAVPLAYNANYVAGFANFLFALPLMVLVVPRFYILLRAPSYRQCAIVGTLFVLLFVAHAHVYLWSGLLCFAMVLGWIILGAEGRPVRSFFSYAGTLAGASFVAVAPSLMLFALWYHRTFGAARTKGGVTVVTRGAAEHFGASYQPIGKALSDLPFTLKLFSGAVVVDLVQLALLMLLVGGAMAIARAHRFGRPPVLELCCIATLLSWFVLPANMSGHEVISGRQPGIALLFLPALVSPVPARVSKVARWVVLTGVCMLSFAMLRVWYQQLARFERTEIAGLEEVMAKAPPRLRLQYVKLDTENSRTFTWHPLWHIDKFYMSDKFGQTPDNPAILTTQAVHYRSGVNFHRVTETNGFEENPEIWQNFELVLVHGWHPPPENMAKAERNGVLLAESKSWQLWRSKVSGPLETAP